MQQAANASGRKKGQFSVELFLALTIFVIVLLYLNNYYEQTRNLALASPGYNNLARQIALLAGESFALNETILFQLPCAYLEGKPSPFWIYGGGMGISATADTIENSTTVVGILFATPQTVNTTFMILADPNPLFFQCETGKEESIVFSKEKIDDYPVPGQSVIAVLMKKA